MKNTQLQDLLKAIEKDSLISNRYNENIQQAISKLYSDREGIENSLNSMKKAHELIAKNTDLLNIIKEKERLEKSIFKATSNAALFGTIGAALSAAALPSVVMPVAIAAGISALGGYISKLKLEREATEGVKSLLEQANSEAIQNEG